MNNQPLVSILSPCYNVEKFLPQCLETILGQTYHNLQLVLIDDGSRDGTWNVMQQYAAKDNRIEIYHQDNQGVAITRNNLLDKVKGDLVLFVDSDDWIEPTMVEFLVKKSLAHKADVTICDNVINDTPITDGYTESILSKDEAIERFLYHKELRGSLWNKLVATSLLHNVRFHCGISFGEDALFCWHFFQHATKIVMTDKQLYHYRMVENSLCHASFGPKKLSGHYAWEQICEETAQWHPQYYDIACARHCVEDVLLLRDAAHSGYHNKKDIKMLQTSIRRHWHVLNKIKITSISMKLYAFVAARSYWLASKI